MSTLNILFQCFPSFQHRYIDDSTSSRRSEVKIFAQNLLPLSSKSIKIKEARWRVSTSLYVVMIFRYRKGGGFVSRLLVYFVRQKLQALLWFFLKFNISRETYYTASLIKIPGVGQRKPSVSVSLIWNKGKSGWRRLIKYWCSPTVLLNWYRHELIQNNCIGIGK